MGERERRIGLNEAVFREVNERVRDVNDTFGVITGEVHIICECGSASCTERLSLTVDEYEHVRADPTLFALAPGHAAAPEVERVVADHGNWQLVEKRPGVPANLARATEPRDT